MTWNYDPSQLATSELMQVRFEISDTDSTNPLLQDEEVTYAISVESTLWGAAARCCETLARRFLALADVRLGRDLSIIYSKQAAQYQEMAKELRLKDLGTVLPYVGGRSIQEKIDAQSAPDAVQPLFSKTMETNPRVGGASSDPIDADRELP